MKTSLILTIICFLLGVSTVFGQSSKKDYLTLDQFFTRLDKKIKKKYSGWNVSRSSNSNMVITGPVATIVKEHTDLKGVDLNNDTQVETEARRKFRAQNYKIILELTPYKVTDYEKTKATNARIKKELKNLKVKHGIEGVTQDPEKGLFTAQSRDEKNRLAKYFIEKKYLQKQEEDIPDLYISDYGVKIGYINHFRVYPHEVQIKAANINQMVRNIIEYGDDLEKKMKKE